MQSESKFPRAAESGSKEKKESEGQILTNIVFTAETGGKRILYKSSAPDRKIVFLEDGGPIVPEPSRGYDVQILRDTFKEDAKRGKYIVRIICESGDEGEDFREEATIPAVMEKAGKRESPVYIDRENGRVFILDVALPYVGRESSLVPKPEEFAGFTLDRMALMLLRKIAMAVRDGQPCLLEGETATAKTSSILYLAMLTGNEVERLNLSGQTDTADLIGKFIPNDGQMQITFEQLLKSQESLKAESRMIISRAKEENRPLTLIESQKIAAFEGLPIPEWRWQNGFVPRAMTEGRWLVLDEINLCEQQILKRLHSALENNPTLTLTEYDGRKIAVGGEVELSSRFRAFATMNPPETHPDCKPLTPAFRNRWTRQIFVEMPTCDEYEQMLHCLITGRQPIVKFENDLFQAGEAEPVFPSLGGIPIIDDLIVCLASFHEDIANQALSRTIGKNRQEVQVFTRRDLLALMSFLAGHQVFDRKTGKVITIKENPQKVFQEALEIFYLDRMTEDDDRKQMQTALKTNGLSANNWLARPSKKIL